MLAQPYIITLHIQSAKLQQVFTQAGQLMDGIDSTYLCWFRDEELTRITDRYSNDVLTLVPMQKADSRSSAPMRQYSIRLPDDLAAFAEAVGSH